MKRILLTLPVVLAAACTTPGQVDPNVMQIATAPLTCQDATQCALWWQRAEDWVRSHSKYEIQTATDTLIQTSGPGGGRRLLAYEITKTPNNDGTATIGFAAHCDSSLGCKPNPWTAGAAFKQYVRTGVDTPIAGDGPDVVAAPAAGASQPPSQTAQPSAAH